MLWLKARLNFCGKLITEDDMIQKKTFYFSYFIHYTREPCYRYGATKHWYKNYDAIKIVVAHYKRYVQSKEQEGHFMEEEELDAYVNLTIADFNGNKNLARSMDVSDYD